MRKFSAVFATIVVLLSASGLSCCSKSSTDVPTYTSDVPAVGTPTYTSDGRLVFPKGYYQWAFLTSDLGMSYNENPGKFGQPPFSNVFVNPGAYRVFLKTGTWPNKTQIVKEFRPSSTKGSINHQGYFQSGEASSILVHVKDEKRFKGGWAFFVFGGNDVAEPAKRLPTDAACYACHQAHGAVDTTFVQFYPTLLPVAIKHKTLSMAYIKDEEAEHKIPSK